LARFGNMFVRHLCSCGIWRTNHSFQPLFHHRYK